MSYVIVGDGEDFNRKPSDTNINSNMYIIAKEIEVQIMN